MGFMWIVYRILIKTNKNFARKCLTRKATMI